MLNRRTTINGTQEHRRRRITSSLALNRCVSPARSRRFDLTRNNTRLPRGTESPPRVGSSGHGSARGPRGRQTRSVTHQQQQHQQQQNTSHQPPHHTISTITLTRSNTPNTHHPSTCHASHPTTTILQVLDHPHSRSWGRVVKHRPQPAHSRVAGLKPHNQATFTTQDRTQTTQNMTHPATTFTTRTRHPTATQSPHITRAVTPDRARHYGHLAKHEARGPA